MVWFGSVWSYQHCIQLHQKQDHQVEMGENIFHFKICAFKRIAINEYTVFLVMQMQMHHEPYYISLECTSLQQQKSHEPQSFSV